MKTTGVHEAFYRVLDSRHDVLVEADVADVTGVVAQRPELLGRAAVRVEADRPSGSDADQRSCARIFQGPEQTWSQVMCPSAPRKPFELGRVLSSVLSTRCVQIEVGDDAWGGHALFSGGELVELDLFCIGDDLTRLLPRLGLESPDLDDDDLYDEVEYFHSTLRSKSERGEQSLVTLAERLAFWIDDGSPTWADTPVKRLDLIYPE